MLTPIIVRLKALVFRRSTDADLDEELRYHLTRETERNIANGMSAADARDAARRALGNVTIAIEQARDAWRWTWLEQSRQDINYAIRTFGRAPAFAVTVIATIGLGLGLLLASFTFFNAYVLRPLAVRDPYSLYELVWRSANGRTQRFTLEQLDHLRRDLKVFDETFAYRIIQSRLRGHPSIGQSVSGNFFQMLSVPPTVGRVLVPSDGERGGVVVLSHHMWRTAFGGDSSVIGSRVSLDGSPFTIVGVAREGFGGLTSSPFDFWVPLVSVPKTREAGVFVVARLARGVSIHAASSYLLARMQAATADLPRLERASFAGLIARGTSIPNNPDAIALFAPIISAFVLVMLIACANVANIMLARGMARQREIGIRLALGAGRARLIRQLLTEALALAIPAGVLGFVVSRVAIWLSVNVMFSTVPEAYSGYLRVVPMHADARVLAFAMLAALAAALAFGLVPALNATRPNIVQASRGDFDTRLRPSRMRNTLVVGQVTMSVVLLICAGVLLTSARHTERLDPGVRTDGVLQIQLLPRFRARGIEALRAAPDVRHIASASSTPLDGRFTETRVIIGNRPAERVSYVVVSPEYFSVLDLPIIAGRGFTDDEARSRAAVVVISQSTAKRFWPNGDAIGQALTIPATEAEFDFLSRYHDARVIGVTRDAVPGSIAANPSTPVVYYPQPLDAAVNQLIVRVSGSEQHARASIEQLLSGLDSSAVVEMHTLGESLALQVYPFRAMFWVSSVVGMIALVLTLIGVYGVISYLVEQRHKEFGIRLALGAASSSLVALVLRQSMRLAVIGVAIGVMLALGISRLFASMLFNVDTLDVAGYVGAIGLVFLACLFATYAPSRRAGRVDPIHALRQD